MTTVEHTHTEFATKDDMSDFKATVTNMMMQLSQANLAANARMDRFEVRMDRLEARLDKFGEDLQTILVTMQELLETNRRGFGFQTPND